MSNLKYYSTARGSHPWWPIAVIMDISMGISISKATFCSYTLVVIKSYKKGQLSLTNPRATLAKSLHGLRKSSGFVSCIASLPIDSVPMVSYL